MCVVLSASKQDISRIAGIHMAAFPGHFLSRMGPQFLQELYGAFLQDNVGLVLIAVRDGQTIGFAAGTLAPNVFFRRLFKRRWYAFVRAAIPAVIREPALVISKLLSAPFFRGDIPEAEEGVALLSSIAVDPKHAGNGVGKLVLNAFCREAQLLGARYACAVTDRDENSSVNRFYQNLHFRAQATFRKDRDRWMIRYVRSLT
jgi:GNAT superfamily N-acetyltransferase